MIIDIHGHYATAPKTLEDWRKRQIDNLSTPKLEPKPAELKISDDALCSEQYYRVSQLFPDNGIGAAMLPQRPDVAPDRYIPETATPLQQRRA